MILLIITPFYHNWSIHMVQNTYHQILAFKDNLINYITLIKFMEGNF